MELNLKTINFWGNTTQYFIVDGTGDRFKQIYLDDDALDMSDAETYNKAIDFIKQCMRCTGDVSDTSGFSFLFEIIAKDIEMMLKEYNDYASNIIQVLYEQRDELLNSLTEPTECYCDKCCEDSCDTYCEDSCDTCCENCQEESIAPYTVNDVSNVRTIKFAQKYIDEVIDPQSELSSPDYNTLLAMFTQYGEWILKQ